MKKSGTYSSKQLQIVSEKGIGQFEQLGRVRVVEKKVGIQKYFRVGPRNSSSSFVAKTNEEMVSRV